jgi:hypothetical protein
MKNNMDVYYLNLVKLSLFMQVVIPFFLNR